MPSHHAALNCASDICQRCRGRGQIAADDDPDMILSCLECEGTGEAEEDYDEGGEDTPIEEI